MMHMNKLLVALAFSILFNSGVVVAEEGYLSDHSSEPSDCYRLVGELDVGLTVGLGIKLCSGTTDAAKTVECFMKAAGHGDDGGFGLNMGFAVNLCKTNAEPFYSYE